MKDILKKINETSEFLLTKGFKGASVAVVLGTGLHALLNKISMEQQIEYNDIPNFVSSTVEFHKGRLILGRIGNITLIVMQGRFHYYEGYTMQEITFPIRVLKAMGVERLLLSNAAGGMNPKHRKGDLILIHDHINLLPENPLRGLNDPAFENRFVDMSNPYDKLLSRQLKNAAASLKIKLKKGIYVAVCGPNLETRAEYRYLIAAGADMVGMSTVPEVIVANHISMPCAAISVITDECNPEHLKPVNITEIIEAAGKADEKLSSLLETFLRML